LSRLQTVGRSDGQHVVDTGGGMELVAQLSIG
jgi:hypothetical protein